jgi:hypothetical protein
LPPVPNSPAGISSDHRADRRAQQLLPRTRAMPVIGRRLGSYLEGDARFTAAPQDAFIEASRMAARFCTLPPARRCEGSRSW